MKNFTNALKKPKRLTNDGNGFTNNPKPSYKPKGSATKQTSHRRGKI